MTIGNTQNFSSSCVTITGRWQFHAFPNSSLRENGSRQGEVLASSLRENGSRQGEVLASSLRENGSRQGEVLASSLRENGSKQGEVLASSLRENGSRQRENKKITIMIPHQERERESYCLCCSPFIPSCFFLMIRQRAKIKDVIDRHIQGDIPENIPTPLKKDPECYTGFLQ